MSVIALKETHSLIFNVADLFHVYTMSRHERQYLTTHKTLDHLITNLPDTDKWANFYVEVHGNFKFDNSTNINYPVSKVVDTRVVLY